MCLSGGISDARADERQIRMRSIAAAAIASAAVTYLGWFWYTAATTVHGAAVQVASRTFGIG